MQTDLFFFQDILTVQCSTTRNVTDAVKQLLTKTFCVAELTSSSVLGQQCRKGEAPRPPLDDHRRKMVEGNTLVLVDLT